MSRFIIRFFSDVDGGKHTCIVNRLELGELEAVCGCGARWTYDSNATNSKIRETYDAHVDYFNRPGTVIL